MVKNAKIAKKANIYQVLETIRKEQPITIESIIAQTGLSRPTIISIIKQLLDDEKVKKSGYAASDIGRQPTLYSLNTASNFAIGIDVDGPPVNIVISDINGKVVYSKSWLIDLSAEPKDISSSVINEIESGIKALDIEYKDVFGIAVGLPASIDIKENSTLRLSRIKKWNNYPIDKDIAKHTGKKVYIRNDAHLMSIAEHEIFNQAKDSLYIVLRSGIGMSAIINNQIYEGEMGNAGYIGHTTLQIDGRLCDCGLKGCFETYCSKRAIAEDYFKETNEPAKFHQILDFASKDDEVAKKVLKKRGMNLRLI
jgi:predicted NBD/HSP70 family sugar kinase